MAAVNGSGQDEQSPATHTGGESDNISSHIAAAGGAAQHLARRSIPNLSQPFCASCSGRFPPLCYRSENTDISIAVRQDR